MAAYRHELMGAKSGKQRDDLNMSADIQYHHNHTMEDASAVPFDPEDDELGLNQQTDEDDMYGEEAPTETDAYEVMV